MIQRAIKLCYWTPGTEGEVANGAKAFVEHEHTTLWSLMEAGVSSQTMTC